MFDRFRTTPSWRHRMYRRLTAAVVGLAAVVVGAGVVASPAQADVAPRGTVWFQGMFHSFATDRCLDSNDAGDVYTIPCNFGAYQQWRVIVLSWPDNQWPDVFIQNVQTGRDLYPVWTSSGITLRTSFRASWDIGGNFMLYPAYSGRWDAWRFALYPSPSSCLDANTPTDTTGQRPYLRDACDSYYQDWKMGF